MADADPLAGVRETFRQECAELLDTAQDQLALLRGAPGDTNALNALFRAIHTIKGGAGAFAMQQAGLRAHNIETTLEAIRLASGAARGDRLATLLPELDALSRDLEAEFTPGPAGAPAFFKPRIQDVTAGHEPRLFLSKLATCPGIVITADIDEVPSLDALDLGTLNLTWTLEIATDQIEAIKDMARDFHVQDALEIAETAKAPPAPTMQDLPTLRVGLHRIDELMNLVGELVINQSMLVDQINQQNLPGHAIIHRHVEEYQRLTRDLQSAVMQIRAQPLKSTFQRMAMVAREAAQASGKEIEVVLNGTEVEVDKTVVERLVEPLTHVVRNAVDHGVEAPDNRHTSGKPTQGVITLTAQHVSGRVIIDVQDDGAGLQLDKLRRKARDAGLDIPKHDDAIAQLIFEPGLSTAGDISDLSGRGVGMDAVRSTIEALGGTVHVQSETAQGTRIRFSLPLTLALMDAMIVRAGSDLMALPLGAVHETRLVTNADFIALADGARGLKSDGRILSALSAQSLFGGQLDPTEQIALVISNMGSASQVLLVDEIVEQRQIVVKGLSGQFLETDKVFGATILGDGRIALILDPARLCDTSNAPSKQKRAA